MDDLLAFYCSVICPILEYGAEIWNGGLTQEQKKSIERIQKRVLRIIYPNLDYDQAITETKLQTLEERRDELCISLIKNMLEPNHKLHSLLPKKLKYIRQKETITNSQRLYNFSCKTERFKYIVLWFTVYTCIILNWLIRISSCFFLKFYQLDNVQIGICISSFYT